MMKAETLQFVDVRSCVKKECCRTEGAYDASRGPQRRQELPTAEQQQPEQDPPVFAALKVRCWSGHSVLLVNDAHRRERFAAPICVHREFWR